MDPAGCGSTFFQLLKSWDLRWHIISSDLQQSSPFLLLSAEFVCFLYIVIDICGGIISPAFSKFGFSHFTVCNLQFASCKPEKKPSSLLNRLNGQKDKSCSLFKRNVRLHTAAVQRCWCKYVNWCHMQRLLKFYIWRMLKCYIRCLLKCYIWRMLKSHRLTLASFKSTPTQLTF